MEKVEHDTISVYLPLPHIKAIEHLKSINNTSKSQEVKKAIIVRSYGQNTVKVREGWIRITTRDPDSFKATTMLREMPY